MKQALCSPILVVGALLAVLVQTSGCKIQSKKEREEQAEQKQKLRDEQQEQKQKEREAAQAQLNAEKEAAARQEQLSQENARAAIARRDLADRIAIYSAIAGPYEGYYLGIDGKRHSVRIALTVNNLPPAASPHRPLREGDIIAQTEALSLDALVEEYFMPANGRPSERVISCNAANIKPDLSAGIIRFSCAAGLPRHYFVGLDSPRDGFETTLDATSLEQRSKRISDDLVLKRIQAIEALNLKIQAPTFDFNGKLWSKKQQAATR